MEISGGHEKSPSHATQTAPIVDIHHDMVQGLCLRMIVHCIAICLTFSHTHAHNMHDFLVKLYFISEHCKL